MPRDFYPNLPVETLVKLLEHAQTASVKGLAASVSGQGISAARDTTPVRDLDQTIRRLQYSLYVRTGGVDPLYPNPYTARVRLTRARFDMASP